MKNFLPYRYLMIFIKVPLARLPILKHLFFNSVWFIVFGIFFFPLVGLYVISELATMIFESWSENASKVTSYLDSKSKDQVAKLHEQIPPEELCKLANIPFRDKPTIAYKGFDDEDASDL